MLLLLLLLLLLLEQLLLLQLLELLLLRLLIGRGGHRSCQQLMLLLLLQHLHSNTSNGSVGRERERRPASHRLDLLERKFLTLHQRTTSQQLLLLRHGLA